MEYDDITTSRQNARSQNRILLTSKRLIEKGIQFASSVIKKAKEDNLSLLAAAISYNAVLSLAPLLVVIMALFGLLIGQDSAHRQLFNQLQGVLGEHTIEALRTVSSFTPSISFRNLSVPVLVSLFGFGLGATGFFFRVRQSLNVVWSSSTNQENPQNSFLQMLKYRGLAFLLVLGLGVLLIMSLLANTLVALTITLLPALPGLVGIANAAISLIMVTIFFAGIYRVLPDAEIDWGDVWFGSIVTGILFLIGNKFISIYLGQAGIVSAYGATSSLIVILLWVFLSAHIFLLGAEITQVFADTYGSKLKT